jgi:transcriptional regulator with XRE-family HTH domain
MFSKLSKIIIEKLARKGYRDAYVAENVRTGISYQIRAIRDHRGWSQRKLAEVLKKPPSVVCRLEDPGYGKLSIQTLLEIASAFDVALIVQFVTYPEFWRRTRDISADALNVEGFNPRQLLPSPTARIVADASQARTVAVGIGRSGIGSPFEITLVRNARAAAMQLTPTLH